MSRNVAFDLAIFLVMTFNLCISQQGIAQDTIFADGFESGDTSAWSVTVGLALPLYVSIATGSDVAGCGLDSMNPCMSIGFGIGEAGSTGRNHIWVAEGTYVEQVVLVDGLKLFGGFDVVDWTRDPTVNLSVIQGEDFIRHRKAVVAMEIGDHPTLLEGFVIEGEDASGWSENSTAVYIVDCSSNLIVRDNVIIAGDGDYGENGYWGLAGATGANGANGAPAAEPAGAFNCFTECSSGSGGTPGGAGGQTSCSGIPTDGGDGGAADCPDFDEDTDLCDECPGLAPRQTVTTSGSTGTGPGGGGGLGGCDGLIDYLCTGGCNCVQPPFDWCPQGMAGDAGAQGPNGVDGAHGAGASDPLGTVFDHEWGGQGGMNGGFGQAGRGGGGAGAGGGVETYFNGACTNSAYSDLGGSGGGGGAGGCPGDGGGGGFPGGGSFAIFVSFSADPEDDVPTISNNDITRGNGSWAGNGVPGGPGGSGGQGGLGGAGGNPGTPAIWCAAAGGNGGPGGTGGTGGDGGGGAGGISCGICSYGYGSADLSGWMVGTAITGGSGGNGGGSLGDGGTGVDGVLIETNFPVNDGISAR